MPYSDTEHTIGHGFNVAYADTLAGLSSGTSIDGTTDVHLPESELGESEITNDDTPDFQKDFLPGLYDPGTVSFSYKYGKTLFATVEALYQLAAVAATRVSATKFWKVTLPDGSTATFKGFLKKHSLPSAGQEDAITCECEIRVRSKITFTPAVAA
jgi:hypothetical protein